MKEKQIIFQNNTVSYRISGKGMPVLLIHGFAEDGNIWQQQVDFLQHEFCIIVPDLPGSGSSPGSARLSIDDYADCINNILDAEKIKACCMIGHSMGGYITLAFAEKYPKKLHGFGLFHSTAYADSEEKKTTRRKSIEFIRRNGSADFIRQSIPNLFSGLTREKRPEIIRELITRYDNFSPESLVSYYEAMIQRPDRVSVLRQFTGPILFIIGEDDAAVPLDHSLQLCHIPGFSYIHILENTAHMGMLESTEEANRHLFSYLINIATCLKNR